MSIVRLAPTRAHARLRSVGVDPLADYLDGPRARHAFLLHVLMEPPWSVLVDDDAPLTLVAALTGSMWLCPAGREPHQLPAGRVAVVQAGVAYVVTSDPGLTPTITIGPGQTCTSTEGLDLSEELASGLRQWGNDRHGRDTLLVASYQSRAEVGRMLRRALPDVLVPPAAPQPFLDALVAETRREGLAQGAVLDRLLDLVLVSVVRAWADASAADQPSWLAVSSDPAVHEAVRLIHGRPAEPWSAQTLAEAVGLSRPALARRFQKVVGTSPMAYLSEWRLALAADLLGDSDLTLTAVSRRVGYASAFSLSAAFKRHFGVSPSDYRAGVTVPAG